MTDKQVDKTKRDFIVLTASAVGAVGAASAVWPLVDSLNPSADVLALASTEVNISSIKEGQSITVMWRGTPVFIRHRTKEEINQAVSDDNEVLPDPENDNDRG